MINEKLKVIVEKSGKSQEEFAESIGLKKASFNHYLTGARKPSLEILQKISNEYNINPAFFFNGDILPVSKEPMQRYVPIYGTIPAGCPALAEENIIGKLQVPDQLINKYGENNLISLKVNGDSMNKVVPDGFVSVLYQTDNIQNGDIVAVLINNCDATLKRVYKTNNRIILEPDSYNPMHQPFIFECKDFYNCPEIKIIGKYIWSCAPI